MKNAVIFIGLKKAQTVKRLNTTVTDLVKLKDIPQGIPLSLLVQVMDDSGNVNEQFRALVSERAGKSVSLPVLNVSGKWRVEHTTYPKGTYECKIFPYFSDSKYVYSTHKIFFTEIGSKEPFLSGFLTVCYVVDTEPFLTFFFRPPESDRKNPFKTVTRCLFEVCDTLVDIVYFEPLNVRAFYPSISNDRLSFYSLTVSGIDRVYEDMVKEGSECAILEFIKKNALTSKSTSVVKPGEYKLELILFRPQLHGTRGIESVKGVTLQRLVVRARIDEHVLVRV